MLVYPVNWEQTTQYLEENWKKKNYVINILIYNRIRIIGIRF